MQSGSWNMCRNPAFLSLSLSLTSITNTHAVHASIHITALQLSYSSIALPVHQAASSYPAHPGRSIKHSNPFTSASMPVQSPMPVSLPKECTKATQIFNSFASIIPQEILRGANGFAILTIAKAGFLFSARAGSGLVIVKLANGSWSAPSAVGTVSCLVPGCPSFASRGYYPADVYCTDPTHVLFRSF